MLTRYWITFDQSDRVLLTRFSLGLGVGVTAFDEADAMNLVRDSLRTDALPRVDQITADVRIGSLERDHVLKNLGNPGVRGVWYPALNL